MKFTNKDKNVLSMIGHKVEYRKLAKGNHTVSYFSEYGRNIVFETNGYYPTSGNGTVENIYQDRHGRYRIKISDGTHVLASDCNFIV